jgi:hypothetical protein
MTIWPACTIAGSDGYQDAPPVLCSQNHMTTCVSPPNSYRMLSRLVTSADPRKDAEGPHTRRLCFSQTYVSDP